MPKTIVSAKPAWQSAENSDFGWRSAFSEEKPSPGSYALAFQGG